MRMSFPAVAVVTALACASAPRGPSDSEVRASLDALLQEMVVAVSSGNPGGVVSHFASDGQMNVRGVLAGEGQILNVELTGPDQIRSFLLSAGAPPEFYMGVTRFERTGMEAEQAGEWSIAGEQTGTFTIGWRQTADGVWQVIRWDFVGS